MHLVHQVDKTTVGLAPDPDPKKESKKSVPDNSRKTRLSDHHHTVLEVESWKLKHDILGSSRDEKKGIDTAAQLMFGSDTQCRQKKGRSPRITKRPPKWQKNPGPAFGSFFPKSQHPLEWGGSPVYQSTTLFP